MARRKKLQCEKQKLKTTTSKSLINSLEKSPKRNYQKTIRSR